MATVFIAGSISIRRLHAMVRERIANVVASNLDIVVGDAGGADASIQKCLHDLGARNVTVYCTGNTPRNNIGDWQVRTIHSSAKAGTRGYFTAKDLEMARDSDYGLMIWDSKSTGTLSNILELLRESKKTIVFINKEEDFMTVSDVPGLEVLLTFMSPHSRARAEEKIGLHSRITGLSQQQFSLPMSEQDAGSSARAESMKLRSELMSALTRHIASSHLSQSQAARVFGVTQPRISDLTRGKVDLFGLDALVNMAATAGLHVDMQVRRTVD